MPIWVDSTLKVSGEAKDVRAFVDQFTKPVPLEFRIPTTPPEQPFSFYNLVAPDLIEFPDFPEIRRQWCEQNWGTKDDLTSPFYEGTEKNADGSYTAHFQFSTSWSEPRGVFDNVILDQPWLDIELRYVSDTGWGGEMRWRDLIAEQNDEWKIPDNHTDWVKHGLECPSCAAESFDDLNGEDAAYPDCPIIIDED